MLRKSSLNAAQRLNVLSSIGNSLKADDIEKGLRGAEDELRLVEKESVRAVQKAMEKARPDRSSGSSMRVNGASCSLVNVMMKISWRMTSTGLVACPMTKSSRLQPGRALRHHALRLMRRPMLLKMVSGPQILQVQELTCGGTWRPTANTTTKMPVEPFGLGQRLMFGTLSFGAPLRNPSPLWKPMRPMRRRSGLSSTAAVPRTPRMLPEASSPRASSRANLLLEKRWKRKRAWLEIFIVDFAYGIFTGDGHPRWRKARLPWLPRMFRLWSKTS